MGFVRNTPSRRFVYFIQSAYFIFLASSVSVRSAERRGADPTARTLWNKDMLLCCGYLR